MRINSLDFAATAYDIYKKQVPFAHSGKNLRGMDSAGFIEYCLRQHGVNVSFTGTNDLFRKAGSTCIPLKDALRQHLIVPGVLLLHVANDGGEPAEYRSDGKGNCDYAMIAINSTQGVYPSKMRKGMILRDIKLESGKPNMVMFCKYIDYDRQSTSSAPTQPTPDNAVRTTANLNLREGPSKDFKGIKTMPLGAEVVILERNGDWCYVNYFANGLRYDGWCHGDYLTSD